MIEYGLRKIRLQKGYTQKYLSRISGISTSMISAIETAQRHPTIPTLHALAKAMQVDINELYNEQNF